MPGNGSAKRLVRSNSERLRDSVNYGTLLMVLNDRKGSSCSLDRQTKPLVLASEITGLSNLTGYLKSENYVVPFSFDPNPVQNRQPALLPRPIRPNDWPARPEIPNVSRGHRAARSADDVERRLRPSC